MSPGFTVAIPFALGAAVHLGELSISPTARRPRLAPRPRRVRHAAARSWAARRRRRGRRSRGFPARRSRVGGVLGEQRLLRWVPGKALDRGVLRARVDLGVELEDGCAELQRARWRAGQARRLDRHTVVVGEYELAVRLGARQQEIPVARAELHLLCVADRGGLDVGGQVRGAEQRRDDVAVGLREEERVLAPTVNLRPCAGIPR